MQMVLLKEVFTRGGTKIWDFGGFSQNTDNSKRKKFNSSKALDLLKEVFLRLSIIVDYQKIMNEIKTNSSTFLTITNIRRLTKVINPNRF